MSNPQPFLPSDDIKVYKRRFLVCLSFAVNVMMNQMLWITFAPIQSLAAEYYNVSRNAINLYSLVYLIAYVPGSLLCFSMIKHYGLRVSFICCSFMQLFGAILRYFGSLASYKSYIIVLLGQICSSITQPFFLNSPARIAAEWFKVDGRDIATALLSIVGPFGVGLGSIIPTLFVGSNATHLHGFTGLMFLELMLCAVGFLFMIFFFYDKPPTTPSISQKLKLAHNFVQTNLQHDFNSLMSNMHYLLLLLGFGIGLGLLNSSATLINQYTSKFGYTTDNAGMFGACLVGAGIFGSVICGLIMETFRSYNVIIKIFAILSIVVIGLLLGELKPKNSVNVMVLFGCLGFVIIPIIPVAFEAAAECTYPINEELSAGMLMTSGQIFGIIYIVIWGQQLSKIDSYHNNRLNFSTYFIMGNALAMLIFIMLYRGKYKRLNAARQLDSLVEEIDDTTTITSITAIDSGKDRTGLFQPSH